MTTGCTPHQFEFQGMTRRTVVASFDGDTLSSDGGVLLLAEVDRRLGLLELFAACFKDHRNPASWSTVSRSWPASVCLGLALGYEDLNDHDELRTDPLLASVVGKSDPTGSDRRQEQDRGKPQCRSHNLRGTVLDQHTQVDKVRQPRIFCRLRGSRHGHLLPSSLERVPWYRPN